MCLAATPIWFGVERGPLNQQRISFIQGRVNGMNERRVNDGRPAGAAGRKPVVAADG